MQQVQEEFPRPGSDAVEHSKALIAHVRELIAKAGGALPFDAYMDAALYAPGLGYYTAGSRKFGDAGDFVTAPETSALFSRVLARQSMEVLSELGSSNSNGDILEIGAGSGVMAAAILAELDACDSLPDRYFILDVSADLRKRQRETLQQKVPELLSRVQWLDDLPAGFRGMILANEFLDALPVSRFRLGEAGIEEQHVVEQGDSLALEFRPASDAVAKSVRHLLGELPLPLEPPYESEISLRLPAMVESISESLAAGLVLFIDYGYGRGEYYLPERNTGTLMCHYRHRAHPDPLVYPGLQDITSYVDFTAVAEAGVNNDLELMGYTSQGQFLLAGGLEKLLQGISDMDEKERLQLSQQVQILTLPGEMGDRFKVMALSRGLDRVISGFDFKDLSPSL